MTLFAGQLDGAVSLGDALRNAKQQYFGSQGLYGAYDEKALSSTILYGLPMFAVGTERPVRPTPPNETTTPVAGAAGLSSTPYIQDFTFAARSGDIGRWYEADTGTGPQLPQITASRPVQPRAELDVTAAAADNSLLPAHGAVVSGLRTGEVVADFDAAFSRPTLDSAAERARGRQLGRRVPNSLGRRHDIERHAGPRRSGRYCPAPEARADSRTVHRHGTRRSRRSLEPRCCTTECRATSTTRTRPIGSRRRSARSCCNARRATRSRM